MGVKRCVPNFMVPTVHDIPYETLWERGVRALCFDIENTLDLIGVELFEKETADFLIGLQSQGWQICFGTSSMRDLSELVRPFDVPVIQPTKPGIKGLGKTPRKPQPAFFHAVARELDRQPREIAMIGDKFVTDVCGAMNCGFVGVLVNPLGRDLRIEDITRLRHNERRHMSRLGLVRPE